MEHPHPGTGRLIGRHAPYDLLMAQAQSLSDRHRHGGRVDHVGSGSGDGQLISIHGSLDFTGDSLHAVIRHVHHPDITPLRLVAADGDKRQFQSSQQRVVAIEDRGAVGLQIFKDLALGLKDALPAAQILNMGVTDVGNNGDIRLHHLS